MHERPLVSIVIPTFRRQDSLRACVESCCKQEGIESSSYEIVIVDNCPAASSRPTVEDLQHSSGVSIAYVHEPRSGISYARNAGMLYARAGLISFLDDDGFACERWLAELLACRAKHSADIVVGPVFAVLAKDFATRPFYQEFFTRAIPCATGTPVGNSILTPFWRRGAEAYPPLGASNSLIDKTCAANEPLTFNPMLGKTGGEDTLFFAQAFQNGARIICCAEAIAWERVEADRLTVGYAMKRAFRSGQLVSWVPVLLTPRKSLLTALSMMIAGAQLPVYAALLAFAAAINSPGKNGYSVKLAGALGRLLWAAPFRFDSYGASAASSPDNRNPADQVS